MFRFDAREERRAHHSFLGGRRASIFFERPSLDARRGKRTRAGVKQIQLDSMGHVLLPWAAAAGFWAELRLHCRNVLHVHE